MAADVAENQLGISWHDSAWIPVLNQANVLEYFAQRTNPFYDRTCNNEVVKMQRLDPSQLQNMTGLEYVLLHVQEPILFVIRKQHRHSPTQVTPLANYYILAGVVYQAPDLGSVLNSRLLTALHNIKSAFGEALSYSRYHPTKGYWWQFKETQKEESKKTSEETEKKKEEPSSFFQRQRVDLLLGDFAKRFPPNFSQPGSQTTGQPTQDEKTIKTEDIKSTSSAATNNTSSTSSTVSTVPPPSVSRTVLSTATQIKRVGVTDSGGKPPPAKRRK